MDLYVSASRIDEFRKVVTTEWASEQMLIDSIRKPSPMGWQALHGTALHDCISDPGRWRVSLGEGPDAPHEYVWTSRDGKDTVTWQAPIVDACWEAWPKPCVFERRAVRDYWSFGRRVTVAGRTDAVHGLVIVEGKTRFGAVQVDDYAESLQWRFYLAAMPWARCVEYRVHEIGGMYADRDTGDLRIAKGGPRLEEIHTWRMWRQPGLEDSVKEWVDEFVAWADNRGLFPYLRPWGERPEAA